MTRALILYAHPCPESFNAAVHRVVVETLEARGWQVDDCDLNKEGFSPVLTEAERRGYHDEPENIEPVRAYVERLRAAEALVLVFPVWNFGYPAILKGFLDRVFLPGVSFKLVDGKVKPNLTHIRKLAACTTYGGTRTRAFLAGDPPRKTVTRAIWHVCRPEKMRYTALYDLNRADDAARARHLARVKREMEAL
ncbi:MAG: flavodoxin family protein [Confluentimicrobium sp.]|jgi:NAD(P)H dehydrogenase (quinone)|uniref:Putative NADPH-quinone reductase n=1 Tax=Actibacterium naphthalenivorans TaxID=1614693 RepID=A0A840CB85_9RHOB|nr:MULTISPECIES: NAD(P)H-dependent oxidoreductase [Actibacterium]KGB83484.1 NAD(P)H dehydrogenase [Rhodovulum sp. NI22]MDY6857837.1 NAD(P)H-dependent oxidoreductase [Pseudomonadota bacterium]ALG89525.1 NAD(P)H dehydrogenase [Actibacterium sp. EMB200-NS6]MBB4020828.1 putative NADPH-quinone reductase [Actibacterium naphthalenivorans]MBC58608.1 flavodoxin family protein [Actibacterium sp.]|tara:strand:- start:1560 stop:2141 length:582 start_codon:yes stop_codon:yes gene_type:complete